MLSGRESAIVAFEQLLLRARILDGLLQSAIAVAAARSANDSRRPSCLWKLPADVREKPDSARIKKDSNMTPSETFPCNATICMQHSTQILFVESTQVQLQRLDLTMLAFDALCHR